MSDDNNSNVDKQRKMITDAEAEGGLAKFKVFTKLSGPGWLQSAITLGGGSLSGALFLGVLGGYSLMWLQLVAIAMGVVMLSAIAYVTLSTGKKPFQAINEHINPVLGWGWAIATCAANMLWCMPQFALSFEALTQCIVPDQLDSKSVATKWTITIVIFIAAYAVVMMNAKGGKSAKMFDIFLKAMVGLIVLSFFGVVITLSTTEVGLPWGEILTGFIPDFSQWSMPAKDLHPLLKELGEFNAATGEYAGFWSDKIVNTQQNVMLAAAATAVGINMTFLMPYSILQRGWDKTFRGLARFDLCTGMAIPFILVTSCVLIASASRFHAQVDLEILSNDPAVMQKSAVFGGIKKELVKRVQAINKEINNPTDIATLSEDEQNVLIAALPKADKTLASALVKRKSPHLATSLNPLLGEKMSNYVFGFGVLAMGFSSIVILMLINGYVLCEMLGVAQGGKTHFIGCAIAGIFGVFWPVIWEGDARMWLAIMVSTFGMMLLPIAYITFFFMMNSKSLMAEEKPKGSSLIWWNILMGISVIGALVASFMAVKGKLNHSNQLVADIVLYGGIAYLIAVIIGFFFKKKPSA